MALLRKDETESADPDLYKTPPKEIADHPLFRGHQTVGLITAESPKFESKGLGGNESLSAEMKSMGLKHEATSGSYGAPEHSFIVYGPTREQMYNLGHRYGQEAVVYSQNGKHEMLYTHGPNAGKYHPSLPLVRYSQKQPEDYFTQLPGRGYITLHFDGSKLLQSPVNQTMPAHMQAPFGDKPLAEQDKATLLRGEVALALAAVLRKSIGRQRWAGSYPWHEAHTAYHKKSIAHGVLLDQPEFFRDMQLAKADLLSHHADGGIGKKPDNEQAAGAGVGTYAKFAQPYGQVNKSMPSSLKHYPMEGTGAKVNSLVAHHGYQVHYAGGRHGKADLANKNYNTGHLMIWDPSAGSGGDFGHADYTDNWRKVHELAHALTYKQLNDKYGEGRRMGGLGKQRTPREAKRAVEWEWLAAHKQRELGQQIGIHISDDDFHRELNTVMHDAVHRAVTGKFTEPSDEGFVPHAHKVPLETAHAMIDEAANAHGLGDHDLLQKCEEALRALQNHRP
jgi:hypothetical protein